MANSGGLYTWSTTASANSTADNSVNWSEGQPPSSVNDSARAMMASAAKWRDDISGALVTTGISTAYSVSSNQVFDSASDMNNKIVAFTPNVTNALGVTLTVDGLGPYPIQTAPSIGVGAGVLIQGTPYVCIFNSSASAFYLHGFFGNPYNIPIGAGMDYYGTTAPNSNFVLPFGQAVSRTTYATLFGLVGTTYGSGDGTTTFNLPDKRGRVSVSLDNMGGTAANRVTTGGSGINGDAAGSAGGVEVYTQQRSDLPNATLSASLTGNVTTNASIIENASLSNVQGGVTQGAVSIGGSTVNTNTLAVSVSGNTQSLNGNVTQTAMNNMPPCIVVPYIMRII